MSSGSLSLRMRQAAFLARHLYLDVYLLEGDFQGTELKMLVADDGSTLAYMQHMTFPDGCVVTRKNRISAFKAYSLRHSDADIVVVGANALLSGFYQKHKYHIIPKWILAVLPSHGEDPDTILGRLSSQKRSEIRRNIRKAENAGYSWDVSADRILFDTFYYDMYKPFAEARYGKVAQLDSYNRVKSAYDKGGVLLIKKHARIVGGSLFYLEGKTLRNPYLGIANADDSVVKEGAIYGLYLCVLKLAHSKGCEIINFGSSRPFLSDGVLRFKLKWGTEVDKDYKSTAVFALTAPTQSEPAIKFLQANPFYELVNDQLQVYEHTIT